MRFTKSLDGSVRATVRVDFRMSPSAAAEALAIEAIGAEPTGAQHVVLGATKQDVSRALRSMLANVGPPEQWNDYEGDPDWQELRRLAGERVEELWPGVRAADHA